MPAPAPEPPSPADDSLPARSSPDRPLRWLTVAWTALALFAVCAALFLFFGNP